MRGWLAGGCLVLVACNAITGASDLAVGTSDDASTPPPSPTAVGTDAASFDARDELVVAERDADAGDAATPDGALDARTDAGAIVFVTSALMQGSFGGVGAGDTVCNTLAAAQGLPGTYVAWLSTNTQSALSRLTATGPWYRRDGLLAATKAELAADAIKVPIDRTETGATIGGAGGGEDRVWTGTAMGTTSTPNCFQWTSTSGGGVSGKANSIGANWSAAVTPACSNSLRLYCFQN